MKTNRLFRPFAFACALAALAPRAARADMIGFATTGGTVGSFGQATTGYAFTLDNTVSVTQLGFYDYQADGLTDAVPVTIWNGSGVALANVTVPAGTAAGEINQYLYAPLATPVTLAAGTYIITGYTLSFSDELPYNVSTITGATGVTWVQPRSTNHDAYPINDLYQITNSYFGPNFQFTNAAPEPSTWALLGVGGAGLLGLTLRRHCSRAA